MGSWPRLGPRKQTLGIVTRLNVPELKSCPRIYGRANAFIKVVNCVKHLTTSDKDNKPFIRPTITARIDAPGYLIGQALTYLISEGFLEKFPADKERTFNVQIGRRTGRVKWFEKLDEWRFEYEGYESKFSPVFKYKWDPHRKKSSRPIFPRLRKIHTPIPGGAWDGNMYYVDEESDSYKEFMNYVNRPIGPDICPKCGHELETDRKHNRNKCKLNIVRKVMDL